MFRRLISAAMLFFLFSAAHAGEGTAQSFFTTQEDHYYHLDESCDEGKKYVISEEAALLFGKTACPICVKHTQPFYTGECEFVRTSGQDWSEEPEVSYEGIPEDAYDASINVSFLDDSAMSEENESISVGDLTVIWPYEAEIWSLNASVDALAVLKSTLPEAFYDESNETLERFDALHAETIDSETGETSLLNPWPEDYAGRYANSAYGMTFLLVDPTEESVAAFVEAYGGGVWIVPAKFSQTEMEIAREQTQTQVEEYLSQHPDMDARCVSHWIQAEENVVCFEFYGSDSQALIDALDLPLCVRASIAEAVPELAEEENF